MPEDEMKVILQIDVPNINVATFGDMINETWVSLNPCMQNLHRDLTHKLWNEKWTWVTTSGNCIRVTQIESGVQVDIDSRRHALHADNGVAAYLYAVKALTGVPFEQWHVISLESLSCAPWYEKGVERSYLEVPAPVGTSPNYRKP